MLEKALDDYSAAIDLGITGYDHTLLKKAYSGRIKIYKVRGEMEKAFADFLKMSELKEESAWDTQPDEALAREYEIIDDI